tara:strand:+ start:369 stop:1610 length:1242 start_codon:yes stop_codon:yes gene_type:complete
VLQKHSLEAFRERLESTTSIAVHRRVVETPPSSEQQEGPFTRSAGERGNRATDSTMSAKDAVAPTSAVFKIIGCVVGVVGSLLVYGILQERIMTRPYGEGEDEEFFTFSVFLVMNNRLVSMCVAVLVLALIRGAVAPVAPIYKYAAVSCSNVIATTCQYEALKYVSFPVQTLGKCAKMIPVMIWGYFISNKRYGLYDYLIATGVMAGCTIFALYGPTTSSHGGSSKKSEKETGMYGIALMGGYLGFDGFTSTFQDKLFTGYQMETYNQMLWVNFCSAIISSFWLMTDSSMVDAIAFVKKHPAAMSDAIVLSAASTLGQLCILFTIKEFGALLFATIMTTRQFLSILLSCILFMHPLTWQQWIGTIMVFSALYGKVIIGGMKKKEPKPDKPDPEVGYGGSEERKGLMEGAEKSS